MVNLGGSLGLVMAFSMDFPGGPSNQVIRIQVLSLCSLELPKPTTLAFVHRSSLSFHDLPLAARGKGLAEGVGIIDCTHKHFSLSASKAIRLTASRNALTCWGVTCPKLAFAVSVIWQKG